MSNEQLSDEAKKFAYIKNQLLDRKNKMTELSRKDIFMNFLQTPFPIITSWDSYKEKIRKRMENRKKRFLTKSPMHIWLSLFGIQVFLFLILMIIAYFLRSILNPSGWDSNWLLTGSYDYDYVISVTISVIILATVGYFYIKGFYADHCQATCFYYSVNAAQSLENGDLIEGSFYAEKLLSFLGGFSETKKEKIGNFKVKIKELLSDIETLCNQKEAVIKGIRENDFLHGGFANHLYMLAHSLFSDNNLNINKANNSLGYLVENSQKYFQKETFLQKHRKTDTFLMGFVELGKLVVVPVLMFLLWLVFGYKG